MMEEEAARGSLVGLPTLQALALKLLAISCLLAASSAYAWSMLRRCSVGWPRLLLALPLIAAHLAAPALLSASEPSEALMITPIAGIMSLAAFKVGGRGARPRGAAKRTPGAAAIAHVLAAGPGLVLRAWTTGNATAKRPVHWRDDHPCHSLGWWVAVWRMHYRWSPALSGAAHHNECVHDGQRMPLMSLPAVFTVSGGRRIPDHAGGAPRGTRQLLKDYVKQLGECSGCCMRRCMCGVGVCHWVNSIIWSWQHLVQRV
jgi:hypothetical protein